MSYQPYEQNYYQPPDPERVGSAQGYAASGAPQDGRFARFEASSQDEYYSQQPQQQPVPQMGMAPPTYHNPDADKRFPEQSPYRDWIFAILFLAHIIGMFITAGVYGPPMLSDIRNRNNAQPTAAPGTATTAPPSTNNQDEMGTIAILVVSTIVSGAFSGVWLTVMKRFADNIIHIGLVLSCILFGLATIVCFASGLWVAAIIYLLIGIVQVLYYYYVRHRIPFAHATLHASCNAIQTSTGPIWVAYGLAVLIVGWFAFWSFTFAAVNHASANGASGFATFFLLVSLFWTSMVLKNIGHVTTAGVVASFYFQPGLQSPTKGAFIRSITTSFGSICFGSLIVSFIRALRAMLREAGRQDFGRVIADCLLSIIERAVAYFNQYAYTQIAIYGYDFITASKRTWELMQAKLFQMIINDDLTGWALFTGIFLGGVCGGIVGGMWAAVLKFDGWVGVAVLAFLLGMAISSIFMAVIDSAITTTFVVWAEDPHTMATNQPENYWRMAKTAEPLYGIDPRMANVQQA